MESLEIGITTNLTAVKSNEMETPIYLLSNNKNSIYIKREDFIPFSFGGNKARKAKYFFKEIDSLSCDCVVTYGSSSSNHCRVIANMAASKNLHCYIISPEEASSETYNKKLMSLFDAKIITVPINNVHDTIENLLSELREDGFNPYFIEGGGHGNLGTQAYVDCYNEIRVYEQQNNIFFDYIFFASGTGTTHAGLVCGQLINNDTPRKIIGISIARTNPRGRQIVIDSIKSYFNCNNIICNDDIISDATIILDDYICGGYGKFDHQIQGDIKSVLMKFGIPMDSTYTGKAYTGMMAYIEKGTITGKNILFIHTGSAPLFFDTLNLFQ